MSVDGVVVCYLALYAGIGVKGSSSSVGGQFSRAPFMTRLYGVFRMDLYFL